MGNNFLFRKLICSVNSGRREKIVGIVEYIDGQRIGLILENKTTGEWFFKSLLFATEYLSKTSSNQWEENVIYQEESIVIFSAEQVQTIIKRNSSNLISLNTAIMREIIVNWEAIAKLAQDTHNFTTKAIQTIISPFTEPDKEQVIENIKFLYDDWYDKKERFIQYSIAFYLESQGVVTHIEKRMDNGLKRADIVASSISTVIEVKRILDVRTLWLAVEQVSAYAHILGMRYSIIVGLPPQDLSKYELVRQEAKRLEKWNLKVIFLDPSSETLGLEKHFKEAPPDSLVTNLLVLITQLREAIMAYIEAILTTTTELLRNAKQQPMLNPSES